VCRSVSVFTRAPVRVVKNGAFAADGRSRVAYRARELPNCGPKGRRFDSSRRDYVSQRKQESSNFSQTGGQDHITGCATQEPKAGKRFVQARGQRKRADFARFVRDLLKRYPRARRIHLVLDNLNTHNPKSLIETFGPVQARRWLKRIVWHHTPKHASWLNMAEIEISVLTKQCLDRRLATLEAVQYHAAVWSKNRNKNRATIDWTFSRADARRIFPELYRHKLAG
jgi:hypothetical protein